LLLTPETRPQELDAFAVDGALERLELLRDIAADRDPVSLHLQDGSARVLACTLMPVGTEDEQTGAALGLELTVAPPRGLLDQMPLSAMAVTLHRDVKVQFNLTLRADSRSPDLLRADLPEALWHFQRRQAFRVAPPPASPAKLVIRYPTVKDPPRSVKVLDISVNGIAFLWPLSEAKPPELGHRLGESRLDLAGQMPLACLLETTLVVPFEGPGASGDSQRWKVGCRFVDQSIAAGRAIQVYVNAAQIRARARKVRERRGD